MSYSEKIKEVIDGSDVAIFMKGTPAFVMCGNSGRALEALRRTGVSVTAVDVLPDPAIRQELSAISGWPTIPQVFVKGELVVRDVVPSLRPWRMASRRGAMVVIELAEGAAAGVQPGDHLVLGTIDA